MELFQKIPASGPALDRDEYIDYFGNYCGVDVYSVDADAWHIRRFKLVKTLCQSEYVYRALAKFFAEPGFFTLKQPNSALSAYDFSRSSVPLYFGYNSQRLQFFRLFGCQGKRFFSRGLIRNQTANQSLVICGDHIAERGSCLVPFEQEINLTAEPSIVLLANEYPGYIIREECEYQKRFILSLLNFEGREKILTDALTKEVINAVDGYEIYSLVFIKPSQTDDDERQVLNTKEFAYFELELIKTADLAKSAVYIISENIYYLALDYHSLVRFYGDNYFLSDVFRLVPEDFLLRVNCLDSLDRTNVILASYFGYKNECNADFIAAGNQYSREYASTNAMKEDLAKLGRRTLGGKFQDLGIWLQRWYYNNFSDALAHDGYVLAEFDDTIPEHRHFHIDFCAFLLLYWALAIVLAIAFCTQFPGKLSALWVIVTIFVALGLFLLTCRFAGRAFVVLPRFVE